MSNRQYKRCCLCILSVALLSQVFATVTSAELQMNKGDLSMHRQVLESAPKPKGGLLDPLGHARLATIFIAPAVNVKGSMVNDYYPTKDIKFYGKATAFVYAYPVRNAHRKMKVVERTETTTKGLIWNGLWIVTCKHCVEGKRLIGVRLNTADGGTSTYLSNENVWTTHPTMDVAVTMLPLGRNPRLAFTALERSHAAGRRELKANKFYEGIPVVTIGYPIGMIEGGRANYPVIRKGYIGQIQGYLANDKQHPHFLVAGSVFPGNSGGPVLVPAGTRKPMGMELGQTVLIGMACKQMNIRASTDDGRRSRVYQNADLAVVIPVDVIHETIESSVQWRQDGYKH